MSKNNNRDVYDVLCDRLNSQFKMGKSRHADKQTGADRDFIYSKRTLEDYKANTLIFVNWVKANYPDAKLKKSNIVTYVKPFFEAKINEGLSAYSLKTYKSALMRSLDIHKGGKYDIELPTRHRTDIKRSRDTSATKKTTEKHFNEGNHQELVDFCRAVGCRRASMLKLTADSFHTFTDMNSLYVATVDRKEQFDPKTKEAFLEACNLYLNEDGLKRYCGFVKLHEKGSKVRYAPILKEDFGIISKVYTKAREQGYKTKLFNSVPTKADYHSYRADYANKLYKSLARPISSIPYDKTRKIGNNWVKYQSGVYSCRGDLKGVKLDKNACYIVSKALGHNRISVFATNYYRG